MAAGKDRPLSVRLDRCGWAWLERESARRSKAAGVPVGPSSIVRALIEREAGRRSGAAESVAQFRKRWRIERLGFTEKFFDGLRDRSSGREVSL